MWATFLAVKVLHTAECVYHASYTLGTGTNPLPSLFIFTVYVLFIGLYLPQRVKKVV